MKFSIIIPCYNEAHVLEQCLTSINQNRGTRDDVQVIIVDNGSTDGSVALAHALANQPQDQVLTTNRVRISAVRNRGASAASGEYLLFLDSDMVVPANWLTVLEDRFTQQVADVIGFVDLPPPEAPWFARVWGERILGRRSESVEVDYLPGRNQNMARTWFTKVGGYNEGLMTGEDKDLVMRLKTAGAKVISDRGVDLVHLGYERTLKEWVRKEFWRQHSHLDLIRNQGASLRVLRFPVLALGHLLWCIMVLTSLRAGVGISLLLVIGWFLPSLLLASRVPNATQQAPELARFTLLYWARFHIAGASILHAAWERFAKEKN